MMRWVTITKLTNPFYTSWSGSVFILNDPYNKDDKSYKIYFTYLHGKILFNSYLTFVQFLF
jgi:hypothetical protein